MTATKHAIAALGRHDARVADAAGRSTHLVLPEELRTGPELVEAPEGPGRIETYTVAFGRDGRPERSMIVVRLDDDRRTMAHGEARHFARLLDAEGVGLRGRVTPGQGDEPNLFRLD